VDVLSDEQKQLRRKIHETIQKVSDDFGKRLTFNTAIAAVMELLNDVVKFADRSSPETLAVEREALEAMTLVLAPIAPHISHSIWHDLGHADAIVDASWPTVDESALVRDSLHYAVQVNGKVRGEIDVPAAASDEEVIAVAKADVNVFKFLEGKEIKMNKVIKGKLVTFAVK
jgi:leucyl-tRNA synthetase